MCRRFTRVGLPTACALLLAVAAARVWSGESPPAGGGPHATTACPAPPDEARRVDRELHLWAEVPKYPQAASDKTALPPPIATYAEIWQPQWQEELGLTAEQKKKLLAIHAKAMADQDAQTEQFKKLPPGEQAAQTKLWGGKPSPWRQHFERDVCARIEAVLTPRQSQTLKDYSFPPEVVGLLYNARICHEIGFTPAQEDALHRIAKERWAGFQQVSIEQAEKQWNLLTPQQQAALPEVVKHQGPTSATLAIAFELGPDFDRCIPAYPMLAEVPVRQRLRLSAEQATKLDAVFDAAARLDREVRAGKALSSVFPAGWEDGGKKQVGAILSPQQLTTLNEIDFRRRVVLALGYPEKRKTVGITAQQEAEFQRLAEQRYPQLYRIEREMRARVVAILTPEQRKQLQDEIDHRKSS